MGPPRIWFEDHILTLERKKIPYPNIHYPWQENKRLSVSEGNLSFEYETKHYLRFPISEDTTQKETLLATNTKYGIQTCDSAPLTYRVTWKEADNDSMKLVITQKNECTFTRVY